LLLAGTGRAEDLVIPGSGNPEYVLDQLAKAFNARQAQHRVVIPPSTGTAGALRDVGEGISSVGRVGRLLKDEERRQGFVHISLGRDPVVIVGGAGVTVRSLSAAQLVDIYSGRITNWRELGGKAAPIRAVGPRRFAPSDAKTPTPAARRSPRSSNPYRTSLSGRE